MAKKKITRKELLNEPDEFLTLTARMLRFAAANRKRIIWGAAAFLALVVVFTGVRYFSAQSESRAFTLLDSAMGKYQTALEADGARKAYEQVEPDFQALLGKYAGKTGGKVGQVLFAHICLNAGETDKAVSLYQAAIDNFEDPAFRNLILNGLGYAYEAKGDYPTAAATFEKIASGPSPVLKSDALFNLGRIYSLAGNSEKSLEAFRKIVSDHPDSMYFDLVKERLG